MSNKSMPVKKLSRVFKQLFSMIIILSIFLVTDSKIEAGLIGGTVKSYNPETNTIIIQTRTNTKAFKLTPSVKIRSNGEKTDASVIEPGMKVSITTKGKRKVVKVSLSKGKNSSGSSKPKKRKSPKKTSVAAKPMRKKPAKKKTKPSLNMTQGWTGFRGSLRDNISHETGLLKEWPKSGPELLWEVKGMGEGYSAVSIAEGTIYTMGNLKGKEQVIALNLKNGEVIWTTPTGGKEYKESRGNGPRCTPTIDDYRIYALGPHGDLACIDSISGNPLWTKNILNDFEAKNIKWGISESVLIDGDKLICTPGGKKGTIVALNKMTGGLIWAGQAPGNPAAGYASPIRIEVGGISQYVSFTSKGIVSVSSTDGKFLWQDGSSANKVANCSTPIYENGKLFYASGYGTGASLLNLKSSGNKTTSKVSYQTKDMKNHHGGMVYLDGYIYGSNDPGIMTCMDYQTGEVVWKNRSVGKGSIAYADGMIYLRSEKGPIALIEATPEGYKEKGKFDQPSRSEKPSWPHPVIYDGKLFIRDMDTLLCYKVKAN